MNRREYLSIAAGGTALLTGGVGSAAAAGGWWDPHGGDGGDGEVTATDFEILDPGQGRSEAGVNVECSGTDVEIDGVISVSNSCQRPVLESATYDGETLTVTVDIENTVEPDGACAALVVPWNYVATITTSSAPESVTVEHAGISMNTYRRECGASGDSTGGVGTGNGDDTGSDGASDTGSDGNTGWW